MKLVYIIIIFSLIQKLSPIYGKSLEPVLTQEDFVKFYKSELFKIAEEFSENAKTISEKLLKEKIFYEPASKELNEVKIFIQDFLQDYPLFKRFELHEPVIRIFEHVINHECDEMYMDLMKQSFMGIVEEELINEDPTRRKKDFQLFINHIQQDHPHFKLLDLYRPSNITNEKYDFKFEELMKQYFGFILEEYELNFKQFIKHKFLPKFLDLNLQDLQLNPLSLSHLDHLTKYEDFKNLHKHFYLLIKNLPKPDSLHTQEFEVLEQINILESIQTIAIVETLIKDDLLSNLSSEFHQNLTQNLVKYIDTFQNQTDILKFVITDPIARLQYYLYDVDSYEDLAIVAILNRKHYNYLLASRFHLESRYFMNKLLFLDLPLDYENYIPPEKQSLRKIPKIIKSRNKYELKMFNDFFK